MYYSPVWKELVMLTLNYIAAVEHGHQATTAADADIWTAAARSVRTMLVMLIMGGGAMVECGLCWIIAVTVGAGILPVTWPVLIMLVILKIENGAIPGHGAAIIIASIATL